MATTSVCFYGVTLTHVGIDSSLHTPVALAVASADMVGRGRTALLHWVRAEGEILCTGLADAEGMAWCCCLKQGPELAHLCLSG